MTARVTRNGKHIIGDTTNAAFPGNALVGRKDGTPVEAGMIGETYDDTTTTFWTTTPTTIISRALDPGVWRIQARTTVNTGVGTAGLISISQTANTHDTGNQVYWSFSVTTGLGFGMTEIFANISVVTTYHLVGSSVAATFNNSQRTRFLFQRIA